MFSGSIVRIWNSIFPIGEPFPREQHEIALDNLDFAACRFNSTLRCPKDKVVLGGSMTFDPSETEESPEIYLFVKASVHTIEEDQSDRKQGKVLDPKKDVSTSEGGVDE